MTLFPIFWLTGNSGAGKTTLATAIEHKCNTTLSPEHPFARRIVVLDGDELRATISTEETLTPEDRRKHNLRTARLANLLQSKGFIVIVAVIAPFASVRKEIDDVCHPHWIYLERSNLGADDRPYEAPEHPHLKISIDNNDARQTAGAFWGYMRQFEALDIATKKAILSVM